MYFYLFIYTLNFVSILHYFYENLYELLLLQVHTAYSSGFQPKRKKVHVIFLAIYYHFFSFISVTPIPRLFFHQHLIFSNNIIYYLNLLIYFCDTNTKFSVCFLHCDPQVGNHWLTAWPALKWLNGILANYIYTVDLVLSFF